MTRVKPRPLPSANGEDKRLDEQTLAWAAMLLGWAVALSDDNPDGSDEPDENLEHDA